MFRIYQCPKRFSSGILRLDLYRHNIVASTQNKVHLQRRIVTLVVEKAFTSLHKCLSDYVLEKTALPCADLPSTFDNKRKTIATIFPCQ